MSPEAAGKGTAPAVRSTLADLGLATLLVALLAALARLGLLALGLASRGALESNEVISTALYVAAFAACLTVGVAAWRLASARKVRVRSGIPALAIVALLTAVGWYGTLREGRYHDFHGVWTQSPSQSWTDTRKSLPHITYRHDRNGFRGAGFDEAKAPGRLRVALVGDSFIFGLGVEEDQTLKTRLDEELAKRGVGDRIEVLNLGIPGANLGTHVRMYSMARERLAADAVVMGVFEDNDLTEWDVQDEIDNLARPSAFSLGVFLLGERPATVVATALAQPRGGASALVSFDHLATKLEAARAHDGAPPLVILDYFTHHPEIRDRFTHLANTAFIPTSPDGHKVPEYHIPNDGHPSVRGNQVFAGLVIDERFRRSRRRSARRDDRREARGEQAREVALSGGVGVAILRNDQLARQVLFVREAGGGEIEAQALRQGPFERIVAVEEIEEVHADAAILLIVEQHLRFRPEPRRRERLRPLARDLHGEILVAIDQDPSDGVGQERAERGRLLDLEHS
jgi:hypothetical protein